MVALSIIYHVTFLLIHRRVTARSTLHKTPGIGRANNIHSTYSQLNDNVIGRSEHVLTRSTEG